MNLSSLNRKNIQGKFNWFFRLSLMKKGIVVVILLAIIILGAMRVVGSTSKTAKYQTAQVQRGTIISTVSESGNVSTSSVVSVTSPADGVIEEVYVKNGDQVKSGDKLFKVKATASAAQQASAYASYLSALVGVQTAQQNKDALVAQLEKDRQAYLDAQNANNFMVNHLISQNPATKSDYTDLEKLSIQSQLTQTNETFTADQKKYNQVDNNIAAANAQLTAASISYQNTKDAVVNAPVDGTVANLAVTKGNTVVGSNTSTSSNSNSNTSVTSTTNGSTVMDLSNSDTLTLVAAVNEVDISKIKTGQHVTVTLDAFSNQTFVGKVTSVDSVGAVSSGVVTYNAYVTLESPPATIYPGMTASSIVIQTDRRDDVLSVPTAAVKTATDGTNYVQVLKNGKVSQVTVTTGITSDSDTEITSGLSEGDEVVTSIATTSTTSSSSTTSPFSGLNRGFGGGAGGGTVRTGGGATRGN